MCIRDRYMGINTAITLQVDENFVKSQLGVNFNKLIGTGLSTESNQTNAESLYALNPLTTYLRVFNPYTHTTTVHDLLLHGEVFNVPYGAASAIYSNRVVITGGTLNFMDCLKSCYEYSLLFADIKRCENITVARFEHTIIVANEQMYVFGGKGDDGYLSSCEHCKLTGKESFRWKEIAPLNEAKSYVATCAFKGYIYIFGGLGLRQKNDALAVEQPSEKFDSPIVLATIERLDIRNASSSLWEVVGEVSNLAGRSFAMVAQNYKGNEGFYIFGGIDNSLNFIKNTYFLESRELEEPKEMKATLIENCVIEDSEGLSNCAPIVQKGADKMWVASKSHFYFLDLNEPSNSSLTWKSIDFTIAI
eukprot:TRINITY_DN9525_c0_g1_i1.p1 TRINITY_DN9525_c0_g1~~TRINITY_DN9525_c0_g1_i1.p1  ORF type:complete len:362 (-),score=65.58 TRINITY_DN9525_c0_g1_i1:60-1145(-)